MIDWIRRLLRSRDLRRLAKEKLLEDLTHAQVLDHFGYLPEEARIRARRAQPPRV